MVSAVLLVNITVAISAAISPVDRVIDDALMVSVLSLKSKVPLNNERVPVTARDLSRIMAGFVPLSIVRLFMELMVLPLPGNEDVFKTMVPLLVMVPPPVNVPFMVRVVPASTNKVPDVTVTSLSVWLVLIFKVPPLIKTLLVAGMVDPPVLLNCIVPSDTVVVPV